MRMMYIGRALFAASCLLAPLSGPAFAQEFGAPRKTDTDINPADKVEFQGTGAQLDPTGKVTIGLRLITRDNFSLYVEKVSFKGPEGFTTAGPKGAKTRRLMDPISAKEVEVYDSGEFEIDTRQPNTVVIKDFLGESIRETVGGWIFKAEDGALLFALNPQLKRTQFVMLEYRPDGSEPLPSMHRVGNKDQQLQRTEQIERYVPLEPHWYLVWYTFSERSHVKNGGP